jgi:hypothetical protein
MTAPLTRKGKPPQSEAKEPLPGCQVESGLPMGIPARPKVHLATRLTLAVLKEAPVTSI